MKPQFGSLARASLLALGMATAGAAYAGPAGFAPVPATSTPLAVTPVQWICDGSAGSPGACRNNDTGEVRSRNALRAGRGNDSDRYERSRDRDDDRRWRNRDRRDDYRYRRNNDRVYFGLGIVPGPRYVDPGPRYRVTLSQAHVKWCHARWRSYRAYDNSYQPTRGPRRQCVSPYS